jgi:hypothetical protein
MGARLFGWLFGGGNEDADRIDASVRRILGFHPQLKLLRRCDARLAPALRDCLAYLDRLLDAMPAPRVANAAAWSSDPWIHAFFGSATEVARVISCSADLRDWFERNPDADQTYAVLGMEMQERRAFGVAQQGELVRRDVPQTTLSFSDHQLRMCGRSEAELKAEVLRRLLDQLALEALAQIDAGKTLREDLAKQRALLRARLRLLQLHGAGVQGMFDATLDEGAAEMQRLQAAIAENERDLERCGGSVDALEQDFELLRLVFAQPQQHLSVSIRRLRINPMNILLEDDAAPGAAIDIPIARIPTVPPSERAFALLRFARRDLQAPRDLLKQAERLLG